FDPGTPLILAGGLTAENVAEAIARVCPWGMDVAGGVETAPGGKDEEKMRRFIEAARDGRLSSQGTAWNRRHFIFTLGPLTFLKSGTSSVLGRMPWTKVRRSLLGSLTTSCWVMPWSTGSAAVKRFRATFSLGVPLQRSIIVSRRPLTSFLILGSL